MSPLLSIQSAIDAATPWLVSTAGVFALMAVGAHVAKRMPLREPLAQFRRLGLFWQMAIVLSVGSATRWAGAKGDRGVPTDPAQPSEPSTPNNDASTIDIGNPPNDSPIFPNLQHGAAVYAVSSFHTHTPTTYRNPGDPRVAGPSPRDKYNSNTLHMPGLVYDYVQPSSVTGIPMGYPKDAPAQLSPTEACPRRPHQ